MATRVSLSCDAINGGVMWGCKWTIVIRAAIIVVGCDCYPSVWWRRGFGRCFQGARIDDTGCRVVFARWPQGFPHGGQLGEGEGGGIGGFFWHLRIKADCCLARPIRGF